MATDQATRQLRDRVEAARKFDKEKLINRPAWGEMNFEEGQRDFDRVFGLLGHLAVMPVEMLPDNVGIKRMFYGKPT